MLIIVLVVLLFIAAGAMTQIDRRTIARVYSANYLTLVCLTLIIAVVVWEVIAPGRWFYCDDSIGFSFIPPFAHTDIKAYGQNGDRYLVAPSFVYLVWGSLVGAAFIVPAFVIFVMSRFHRKQIDPQVGIETNT